MTGLLAQSIRTREPRTSHGMVVAALGREIVSGVLAPGAVLPGDRELGERFGVSRTVLREAMKTLAAKSLVEAKTRIGTRVTDPASWNMLDGDVLRWRVDAGLDGTLIRDLAAMRLAFEPAAAELAADRATADDIARLYAITARMDDPAHDRASIARADLEFHLAIIEISRNPFMRAIGNVVEAALAIIFRISSPAGDPAKIHDVAMNHRAIVDAIADRDSAAIRATLARVIEVGAERTGLPPPG